MTTSRQNRWRPNTAQPDSKHWYSYSQSDVGTLLSSAGTACSSAAPIPSFRLLGPLEFSLSGRTVNLSQRVHRIILASLILSANQVVSISSLIELIWPEESESRRINNLHYHISRIRSLLRELEPSRSIPRIITSPPGYRFIIDNGERDIDYFSQLVSSARDSVAGGRQRDAARLYRQALALWRGAALDDVRNASPWLEVEAERLDLIRLEVLEERLDVDLVCREHSRVVTELTTLAAQHPRRERLRCQLMVALYRCGRQLEALEVYSGYATMLRDEFGLDPGPAMQQVRQEILTQELEPF
jgi:DNA-binding SARP family transcriptional activator